MVVGGEAYRVVLTSDEIPGLTPKLRPMNRLMNVGDHLSKVTSHVGPV